MTYRWFLDYLGKSVSKDRIREMCRLMEMGEGDTEFILHRFCRGSDGKPGGMYGAEHIGPHYSEFNQRKWMPQFDDMVRGWCEANTGYFKFVEMKGLAEFDRTRDRRTGVKASEQGEELSRNAGYTG